jgi:hypothetical protein
MHWFPSPSYIWNSYDPAAPSSYLIIAEAYGMLGLFNQAFLCSGLFAPLASLSFPMISHYA